MAFGSSSTHYHQSNGREEAAIKSMNKLVIGSRTGGQPDPDKLAKDILLFRNAPRYGGASPDQLVFNRPIRDSFPTHERSFAPEWQRGADVFEKPSLDIIFRLIIYPHSRWALTCLYSIIQQSDGTPPLSL